MSAWGPGNGGSDVITSGGQGSTRLRPGRVGSRAALALTVGALLAARLLGVAVAAREPASSGPSGMDSAAVATCALRDAAGGPEGRAPGCPSGRPLTTRDLAGTWLRTGVAGVWRGRSGREFLRFDPDGVLTWGLVGPYRDAHGRYVLTGHVLTVAVDRPGACGAWRRAATWWATMTHTGRLRLAGFPGDGGGCSAWLGRWSGRRAGDRAPVARGR